MAMAAMERAREAERKAQSGREKGFSSPGAGAQ